MKLRTATASWTSLGWPQLRFVPHRRCGRIFGIPVAERLPRSREGGEVHSFEGRSPLAYVYTAFDLQQLAAYYIAADVALITPLRDGMNLVAKEYVACHSRGDGILILSEFAGAARELTEALPVNPYDPEAIRRQMDRALAMPPEERRTRMSALARKVAALELLQ